MALYILPGEIAAPLPPEPLSQLRPPSPCLRAFDGDGERLALTHQDDETLAPSYARIDQLSLQHRVMLGRQRDNDGSVFRSLALVDRCRVGQHQLVQLADTVDHLPALEIDRQFALLQVEARDDTKVAVVDLLVVVVLDLHALVAETEGPAEPLDTDIARRV